MATGGVIQAVDPIIAAALARNAQLTTNAAAAIRDAMTSSSGQIFAPPGFIAQVPALRGDPPVFQPSQTLTSRSSS